MTTRAGITTVTSDRTQSIRYRARFSWTDEAGQRRHRSRNFRVKKHAQEWLNARRREADRGEYADASPETMAEVAERWLAGVERSRTASTVYAYRHWWDRVLAPEVGARRVASIRASEVQALYDRLGERYRGGSLRVIHRVLCGILDHARLDGIITDNPARGRRIAHDRPPARATWMPAEGRTFLAAVGDRNDAILWVVVLATGLRIGEALALHWQDVDLDARTVRVRRTLRTTTDGTVIADTPKTAHANRTVILPAFAVLALRRQRVLVPEAALVFPGGDGRARTTSTCRRELRRLCDVAGVPCVTPHGLRRTAATIMAERRVPVNVAASQLGHSVSMMMTVYAQITTEMRDMASDAMEAALTSPTRQHPEASASGSRHNG